MQNHNVKEKLDLKKRAYIYALNIIRFFDTLDKNDYSVQIISKQLLRSATSIGANITEAQAGSSKKDFTNFFSYALKSVNETIFWLSLLKDSHKTRSENIEHLFQETVELANILGSSVLTLKGKR